MKAIQIHSHGGPEVLCFEDVDSIECGKNDVRIKIHFSSLNHMDLWVRNGIPGIGALPLILGCDASGIIEEVGTEVSRFQKGDRVFVFPMKNVKSGEINLNPNFQIFGEHIDGMHREEFVVDESLVYKLDDRVSLEEGAAFPLVGLTAWHMVMTKGQVKPNETVLVMGATSGVGSSAIQIAKAQGASIIATAGSTEKIEIAKRLGADHVINHYEESISKSVKEFSKGKGVDVIIEHVGEKVWQECLKSLGWGGRLVTCGATTGPKVTTDLRHIFIKQQSILGSTMGTPDEMELVHECVAKGQLKPTIGKIYNASDVKQAHEDLEKGLVNGKALLKWV